MFIRSGSIIILASALLMGGATLSGEEIPNSSPVFGVQLPAGYRNWHLISVAHEAGSLNDIRAILGNDIAAKAYAERRRPFPDGAILARLAWRYVPSERNNAIFGQPQSFVAGDPTNVQIAVKNSRIYAATDGWGYGQFEGGKANQDAVLINTCHACHVRLPKSDDLVFTQYSP